MSSKNLLPPLKYAYFGGGCFWCIEAVFQDLIGVQSVTNGYSGGLKSNANYQDVSAGKTKHTEICKIGYNPDIITFDVLLKVFFLAHNPTLLNQQGHDLGPQYRSIIFYNDKGEKEKAQKHIKTLILEKIYSHITTQIEEIKHFFKAEKHHQNYFNRNPHKEYCSYIINPKINKLRKKLSKYYPKKKDV